jgi:CheY-like chemotaxis protein
VAKILVADDNSNIQKMVGLALKDQGIEVVAVGNGEAAVRKIPDLRPDLVLADVFMPVRTGYEVCEFVKKDPTLSHIPVILLVGAFDPLDEQEAQRVGADGVLKKPFVPPDPLIAMVKAALARAGVSLTGPSDKDKPPKKASEMLPSRPIPLPMSVAPPVAAAPQSISIEDTDGLVEEVAVHPAPVTMTGGAPLAFGNLMGTTETEEDPGFAAAAHPEMTVERDWRAAEEDDEVPEEEEEEQPKASWRRDADDLGEAEPAAGVADSWREAGLKELSVARKKWEAPAELPSLTEAASTLTSAGTATSVLTETPAAIATKTDQETVAPAFSANAWASAINAGTNTAIQEETAAAERGAAASRAVDHDAVATAIDRFAEAKDGAEPSPLATGAWEVQAFKATQLAATWDAPVAQAPVAADAPVVAAANDAIPEVAASPVSDAAPVEASSVGENGPVVVDTTETIAKAVENSVVEAPVVETVTPEIADVPEEDSSHQNLQSAAPADELVQTESHVAAEGASPYASGNEPAYAAEQIDGHDRAGEAFATPVETEPAHAERAVEHVASLEDLAAAVTAQATKAVGDGNAASNPEISLTASGAQAVANDDLVARVLASLSPEVMQAVTREILKPVVEAMVREELNKRK